MRFVFGIDTCPSCGRYYEGTVTFGFVTIFMVLMGTRFLGKNYRYPFPAGMFPAIMARE